MPTDNILDKNLAEEIYKQNLELLEQRKRTEQLLYGVSEAVISVDTDYKITIFNRAAEKMFRVTSTGAVGKNYDDIVKIEADKGGRILAKSYCFQKEPEKGTLDKIVLRVSDRGYYINLKTNNIELSKNHFECLITMTDVTREVELDKTKDDFISVTSHELRTPITIIKSYLWMLQNDKGGTLTQKQRDYIEKAIKGSERLLNLINDTLNISRMENGKIEFKIEELDLVALLKDYYSDFKIKTDEKKLELILDAPDNLKHVFADKDKMREILTNFFGNSFKFTATGSITIKAENTENNTVKVSIKDTGKGISKDDLKRLFLKFGRLDNSYQTVAESAGTGLGLYIVKQYIEEMAGSIGAYSDGEGKGSTFWFTLPTVNKIEKIESIAATSTTTSIAPTTDSTVENNITTIQN